MLTSFPLDINPGMGLLDNIIVLLLVFGGAAIHFSIMVVLIVTPRNSVQYLSQSFFPLDRYLHFPVD
jgi:hypothetical protein